MGVISELLLTYKPDMDAVAEFIEETLTGDKVGALGLVAVGGSAVAFLGATGVFTASVSLVVTGLAGLAWGILFKSIVS